MPWGGKDFAAKHNKKLKGAAADKAARVATAMVERGVPDGIAIATANARAGKNGTGAPVKRRAKKKGTK